MAVGRIFGNHRAGAGSGGAGGADRPAQSATGLPTVPAGAGGRRLYRKRPARLLPAAAPHSDLFRLLQAVSDLPPECLVIR